MSSKYVILGGSSGRYLAIMVSRLLGIDYGSTVVKKFPDGETYIKIVGDIADKIVRFYQQYHQLSLYMSLHLEIF